MQKIAKYPEVCWDALLTRVDGRAGFHSKKITKRLLKKLDKIDPDVVHLHVLCNYWINIKLLFEWLAKHHCKVVWTLHDCWAFTGHCIHFTYVGCRQWETGCAFNYPCPQKHEYPETFFGGDKSVIWCYEQKKHLFTMIPKERLLLITPSKWLYKLVKQSFLGKYEIKVQHNHVDSEAFKPTYGDFRERYNIKKRFMILGVANKWGERKGLKEFIRLSNELDSEKFSIVVVGLTKKQIKEVESKLIALPRTNNKEELAEIYTTADILFNPSPEESFGMNVAEAASCGTRSIVVKGSACAEVSRDVIEVLPDFSNLKSILWSLMQESCSK